MDTLDLKTPEVEPAQDDEDTSTFTGSVDLGDKCPACRETILLGHLSRAVCTRGHRWGESN